MRIGAGRDDGGRGGGHASEDGGAGAVRGRHVARASRRIVASARRDRRPQAAVPAGCSRLAVRTGAAAPHLRSGSRSAAPRGSPALPVRAGRLRRGGPRTACDHRLRRPTVPRAAPGAEPDQAEARAGRRPEHSTEDNEAPPFARSNARGMRLDRGRCALQSYLVPSAATAAVERFGSGGATGPLATAPETCSRRRPTGSPPSSSARGDRTSGPPPARLVHRAPPGPIARTCRHGPPRFQVETTAPAVRNQRAALFFAHIHLRQHVGRSNQVSGPAPSNLGSAPPELRPRP